MKMVSRVLLTAAAIAALAAPAMAADKLIVKDAAGTTDVFKVDDAGTAVGMKMAVGIGASAPFSDIHSAATSTSAARGITASQHNAGAQGAAINFVKSRGTYDAPAVLSPNDYIGTFAGLFWDGTAWKRSAQFGFRTEAGVSGSLAPTLIFFQTGDTTTTLKEGMRVTSAQSVVAGNLGGTATADMATTVNDGFLYIPNVAGALTSCGTATVVTGHSPIWYDTINNKICSCRAGAMKCTAALN